MTAASPTASDPSVKKFLVRFVFPFICHCSIDNWPPYAIIMLLDGPLKVWFISGRTVCAAGQPTRFYCCRNAANGWTAQRETDAQIF